MKAAPHPRALTVAHAAWLSTAPSPEESAIPAPRTWCPCPVSRLCALFVDVRRRRRIHHDVLPQVDDLKLVDRMLLTARKLHRVVPSPREHVDRGEGDPVDKLRQLCRRPATEARTVRAPTKNNEGEESSFVRLSAIDICNFISRVTWSLVNHRTSVPLAMNLYKFVRSYICLLYTSPSPRDRQKSRMPSSA